MAAAAGLVGHADPGADGLSHPRPHSRRARESAQPRADRGLPAAARRACCACPRLTLAVAALVAAASTLWPLQRLGGEFMPPLDEGDLLYMPSALPGHLGRQGGGAAAADRPADHDRARSGARVRQGRAAPRPPPIPRRWRCSRRRSSSSRATEWRPGMTPEKLVEELDRIVQRAGPRQHLGAADPQPHRHAGDRHQEPGRHQGRRRPTSPRSTASPRDIERAVKDVPGVTSALAERADRRALHRRRASIATRRRATA